MNEALFCANPKCSNPLTPAKRPYQTRIYCTKLCSQKARQQRYRESANYIPPKKTAENARRDQIAYKQRHPARYMERVWRQNGINFTYAEYIAMYEAQGGRCALCLREGPMAGSGRLKVDHDHDTGVIRGLLHTSCNTAIAILGDTSAGLRHAMEYLEAAGS